MGRYFAGALVAMSFAMPALAADGAKPAYVISFTSTDAYPAEAVRARQEGNVGIAFDIDVKGRIVNCKVVQSSGFKSLDEASCPAQAAQVRFHPATDEHGKPIISSKTLRVVWRLPK